MMTTMLGFQCAHCAVLATKSENDRAWRGVSSKAHGRQATAQAGACMYDDDDEAQKWLSFSSGLGSGNASTKHRRLKQ